MAPIRAELLMTPECPHAAATEERLRTVLTDMGQEGSVRRIVIKDMDEAASYGFTGSPTLRIEGRDVVPGRSPAEAALGCRLYRDGDGQPTGVVPLDAIRDAVAAAILARERPGVAGRIGELPGRASRALFVWASHQPRIEGLVRGLPASRALVERFIAAEDLDGALGVLARLRDAGFATTVDVLGEAVSDEAASRTSAERYVAVLDALHATGLDGNVSLKLTQIGLGLDRDLARTNLARVAGHARARDAFVRVDMEDSARTQVTLDLVRQAHAEHGNVGAVIQSYLRRSRDDVEDLVAAGIRVRLCKGAYNEPSRVAFASKREVDESFALLAELLLAEGTLPALATHDERLVDGALDLASRRGIEASRFEFQMLLGIRRDLQERLRADGYRVRVYVPFGSQWYPYYMRRLAERPANMLFILRNLLRPGG